MKRKTLKQVAAAWVICGALTWAQAVYENGSDSLEVKALAFPTMIVVWPLRVYFLVTRAPTKPIPMM